MDKPAKLHTCGTGLIGAAVHRKLLELNGAFPGIGSRRQRFQIAGSGDLAWGMITSPGGLSEDVEVLRKGKAANTQPFDLDKMVRSIKEWAEYERDSVRHIFVDCTAAPQVSAHYAALAESGVGLVFPNKSIFRSGRWPALAEVLAKTGMRPGLSTTIGAGVPIAQQIQRMRAAGVAISKVEMVCSGTLNFILSQVTAGRKFSEVVADAMRLGLTEPDPRVDLSAADVKVKMEVVLALMGALGVEPHVTSLLPDELMEVPRESFLDALKASDADARWEADFKLAQEQGKKIAYRAWATMGQAYGEIVLVGPESPIYHLQGPQNCFILTGSNGVYEERPLVLVGDGAGPAVTAAQIVADIAEVAMQ